jgi:hypothetical protein
MKSGQIIAELSEVAVPTMVGVLIVRTSAFSWCMRGGHGICFKSLLLSKSQPQGRRSGGGTVLLLSHRGCRATEE